MMRRLVTFCTLTTFGAAISGLSAPNGAATDFGAKYTSLKPEQKMRVEVAAGGHVLLRAEAS
jgi:hypothetical protein